MNAATPGTRDEGTSLDGAYLDHAATTPRRVVAVQAYVDAVRVTGNPSSLHARGRHARRLLEEARESVAASLGAGAGEVVFTGGGTESVNLGVQGLYRSGRAAGRGPRLVHGATEHHAVLDAVAHLAATAGAEPLALPVAADGRPSPDALADLLSANPEEVALVTVMAANNEVGARGRLSELAAVARAHGVPLHSDAIAAAGHIPIDLAASGASALSIAAHKFGGPVGSGALLVCRDADISPLVYGGGHERGLRSGTQDVAAIAAMAAALREAVEQMDAEAGRLERLRARLVAGVRAAVPDVVVNGPTAAADRLPTIAHFGFPGCEGDALLMLLDAADVWCSTGSACTAGVARPSHVLLAMGAPEERARGSLRLSLGHDSTAADVDRAVAALPAAVERARAATTASRRFPPTRDAATRGAGA